ncbi:hypothetical protein Gotri_009155 [Gossypium trilobum]|uniref:Uncharacterized protein n=2 Tax=Gossypium TaxID=3633 RepID=A0A7J9ELJ2_9ROSI|nr:hypothetical protein [Gossypium trilobum]
MEVDSFSPVEQSIWVCSVMEALLAETLVLAGKSLACLLMLLRNCTLVVLVVVKGKLRNCVDHLLLVINFPLIKIQELAFMEDFDLFSTFIFQTGSMLTYKNASLNLTAVDERFPFDELLKMERPGPENKDASDTEDDDEDEDEDNADDQDDDGGDEDFSGEEGEEGDPEDDPEANGDGGSDEEDDDDDDDDGDEDDDDDDDGEDEEEEDEEDEDDEVPQPPSKKRK